MEKTIKNRRFKKIIAGLAATTLVVAAGSALAVNAANYYTFDPTTTFNRNGTDWNNFYNSGTDAAYAYNGFWLSEGVTGKSTVRMSGLGVQDTKAVDNFSADNYRRYVESTTVHSASRYPNSMNMSITRGSTQIDNYYNAK